MSGAADYGLRITIGVIFAVGGEKCLIIYIRMSGATKRFLSRRGK